MQPAVNVRDRCLSVERVVEMVSNETNFCSEEYAGTLRNALEGVKLYLESFKLEAGRDMAEERALEKVELSWLGRLGSRMRELSERHGEAYAKRTKPTKEWQANSARICEILKTELDLG